MTNPIFKDVRIEVTRFLLYAGKYNFTRPNGLIIVWSKLLPYPKRSTLFIIRTLVNRYNNNNNNNNVLSAHNDNAVIYNLITYTVVRCFHSDGAIIICTRIVWNFFMLYRDIPDSSVPVDSECNRIYDSE